MDLLARLICWPNTRKNASTPPSTADIDEKIGKLQAQASTYRALLENHERLALQHDRDIATAVGEKNRAKAKRLLQEKHAREVTYQKTSKRYLQINSLIDVQQEYKLNSETVAIFDSARGTRHLDPRKLDALVSELNDDIDRQSEATEILSQPFDVPASSAVYALDDAALERELDALMNHEENGSQGPFPDRTGQGVAATLPDAPARALGQGQPALAAQGRQDVLHRRVQPPVPEHA